MSSQVVNLEQKRTDRRKKFAETVAILKEDPHDVRARLQVIELLQEEGRTDEAVEEMLRVAANYARRGVPIKAVAVMRTAVKLRPERADVRMSYAEVFEKLRMVEDAAREYRAAWDLYIAQSDLHGAIDALGKLLGLDPAFVPGHVVFAEALGRAGRVEQAAAAFRRLADHLLSVGATEDWERVAERAVFFDPRDATLAHDLALHYVRTGRHAAALSKLIVCYEVEPDGGELVELIVEVLDSLGQRERAAKLLRMQVARYRRDGLSAEVERGLIRLHSLDPDDAEAKDAAGATGGSMAADTILELQADAPLPPSVASLPRRARPARPIDDDEIGFGDSLPQSNSGSGLPPPVPDDDEAPPIPDDGNDLDALAFDVFDGRPTMRGAAAFESQGFPVDAEPAMVMASPPAPSPPPVSEHKPKRVEFSSTAPERPSLRRTISRPTLTRSAAVPLPVSQAETTDIDHTAPLLAVPPSSAASRLPSTGLSPLPPRIGDDDEEPAFGQDASEPTSIDERVLQAIRGLGVSSAAARTPASEVASAAPIVGSGFTSALYQPPEPSDPDSERSSRPLLNARRRSNNLPRPKLVRASVAPDPSQRNVSNDLKTLDFFIDRGFYESAVALCAELEKRHPQSEELLLRRNKIAAMARRP